MILIGLTNIPFAVLSGFLFNMQRRIFRSNLIVLSKRDCGMAGEAEVEIPLLISFLKVLLIVPFTPPPPDRSEANISSRLFRRQYKYAVLSHQFRNDNHIEDTSPSISICVMLEVGR